MDMATIRAAILKNRGGWDKCTDEEVLRMWELLPAETRQEYLDSLQPKPPAAVPAEPAATNP